MYFKADIRNSEGVLSDADGMLVIKPCTQAEVSFYESAAAKHPAFVEYMPAFMGTLTRNAGSNAAPNPQTSKTPIPDAPAASSDIASTAATLEHGDVGPMHGKALATDLHIVLENVAAGFTRPNILDVKLGARLWDDDAPLAKRARLDDVAMKSTSGSLGFRIAGMKLWGRRKKSSEGKADTWDWDESSGYTSYNKLYGRNFNADNVHEGFVEYMGLNEASKGSDAEVRTEELLSYFTDEVRGLQKVLEAEESRMYSASILFVYEGDPQAYEATKSKLAEEPAEDAEEEEDEAEDGDNEKPAPKLAAVKIIDFAHARWTAGDGPDENALQGIRSTTKILAGLMERFSGS